uniref:CREG-like beta-barrel domain-containing protein n=1 Tax=Globisporangium ultimum (strain ATCC 200006 / CBS 805.95 / DAOM BR144) TaxID=431595 RepID=K3W6F2_GLOUD
MKKNATTLHLLLTALLVLLACSACDARRSYMRHSVMILSSVTPSTAALHARQLVHENEWGTLATISKQFNGVPFANIVSYSDGVGDSAEAATGEMFFYLTPMDSTASDLAVNPSASVSISMAQGGKGACKMDVEDPTCWKLSFTGTVVPVPADKEEYAKKALFSKHPQMKYWPSDHGFKPYVLKPENIVLLDYYGGAKHIPVDEYYSVKLSDESDDDMEQRFRIPEYYRIKH